MRTRLRTRPLAASPPPSSPSRSSRYCPSLLSAAERTWSQSYSLSSGGTFGLENINGDVVVEGWDGAEVSIEATITSPDQQAVDEVEIEVDASTGSVEVSTEYPERKGRTRYQAASVAYHVRVPRDARADIELVNGDLTLDGVAGSVDIELVNGDLTATDLGGDADLATVNGAIRATFDRLDAGQQVDLESVNGSVELVLPAGADAMIEAETVHGDITSDFDLVFEEDRYVGREASAKLGSGGGTIDLENVNGSITIRRR